MDAIIAIVGGLGLFLYGMKIMSESLQNVAGESLKNILWKATSNRFKGVATGFFITSIIQSSSATTVMVISFVSAGLITLHQSVGIILGANIGTTVTGWLVAILGFKIKITLLALPAIAIGFFIRFFKNERITNWGEVLVGFGLLFLGLTFMSDSVKEFRDAPFVLDVMSKYKADSLPSTVAVILVGTAVTMVVQSSSATMAMTMTLAYNGFIDYQTACALVLGENIGTTITANLAAINLSISAKRAALIHFLFNLLGVIWVVLVLEPFFLPMVDFFIPGDVTNIANANKGVVADHLAGFHSFFNIANTLVFLPFTGHLARLAERLIPQKQGDKAEEFHMKFISSSLMETPAMNINQARLETKRMISLGITMYDSVQELIKNPNRKMNELVTNIAKYENQMDLFEKEISDFLVKVAKSNITEEQSQSISGMLHMVNDLERIGDHCESLLKLCRKKYEEKLEFTPSAMRQIEEISSYVHEALVNIHVNFDTEDLNAFFSTARNLEDEIDRLRRNMKKDHIKRLNAGTVDVSSGLIFIDMLNSYERIGDHVFNIAESISGQRVY